MNDLTQTAQQQQAARPAENVDFGVSPLMNPARFDHMYRIGRMLSTSALWPAHLKGRNPEEGAANGMLCLNMAERLREDPLTVAQNIYFVSGKPGWNTTYMIAKANMHGVFADPIDWEVTGKGDDLSVTAFSTIKATGKRVNVTVGMSMARAEGWTKNAKYKSMPEQMLRYRSAAFLIRLYCPEVMIGMPAAVEVELSNEEFKDVTPTDTKDVAEDVLKVSSDTAASKAAPVNREPPKPAETEATKAAVAKAEADAAEAEAKRKAAAEKAAAKQVADAEKAAKAKMKAEADAKAKQEAEAAAQQAELDKAHAEAQAEARAQAQAAAETPHDPETGEVKEPSTGADYERLAATSKAILKEIENGAPMSAIRDFYGDALDKMEAGAPELYAEIMEASAP